MVFVTDELETKVNQIKTQDYIALKLDMSCNCENPTHWMSVFSTRPHGKMEWTSIFSTKGPLKKNGFWCSLVKNKLNASFFN